MYKETNSSPLTAAKMMAYQKANADGKLAVELAIHEKGRSMPFIGPISVQSSIGGHLLTHDIRESLKAVGISPVVKMLRGGHSDQIRNICTALKNGRLPILYVGVGLVGYWVAIWDLDRSGQKFLVFDTSPEAEKTRRADGLNRYGVDELVFMSKREVLGQRVCSLFGNFMPRFLALPGTLILA